MQRKQACLIVQPRDGQNLEHLAEITQIFTEHGWQVLVELSKYSGHAISLATRAVYNGADLIVAYGGDGTLNAIVNGVMQVDKKNWNGAIAVLPGGTVNLWANEMGLPPDPVEAARLVVTSNIRSVDVVRFGVMRLAMHRMQFASGKSEELPIPIERCPNYFLLMAGMGIDAAILNEAKQHLKQQLGVFAINIAAVTTLPQQRPFPIQINTIENDPTLAVNWEGEAFQIVVGNTRRRANDIEMTPNAYVDDGLIDACVITANNPLGALQQAISLLTRQQPDEATAEFFRGAQISITLPADVDLQIDGDLIDISEYLREIDQEAFQQPEQREQTHLTYRFSVLPGSLRVAVPALYQGDLFKP